MPERYSSPEEVISYTGIRASDLGIRATQDKTEDERLVELIDKWLVGIKNLIDEDRNRDYHDEVAKGERNVVPPGIEHIALRMASNMVAQAVMRRETPIVRVDDFNIRMVEDHVFTNAIRNDLSRFPMKRKFKMTLVKGD